MSPQYLTRKARRFHPLDWPISAFLLLMGSVFASIALDTLSTEPSDFIMYLCFTGLCLFPVFKIIQRRIRVRWARMYAGYFIALGRHSVPLQEMESSLPRGYSAARLQALIHEGLITDVFLNAKKGDLVFPGVEPAAPVRQYSVKCPSCGAGNTATTSHVCYCRFCGSALPELERDIEENNGDD